MEHTGRLCESDYRFMCIIWENEPLSSMQLVKLCDDQLGWKKSTTFTMIRRMSEKGYVQNVDAVVRSLIPRTNVEKQESETFMAHTFDGSLPRFLVSFLGSKTISKSEAEELKKLIDSHRE